MLRFGCSDMSDGEFLRSFSGGTVPASQFHHGDHLRLGWLLLERLSVSDATDVVCRGLRSFAMRAGAPQHYNETMSRGWMALLATGGEATLHDWLQAHADELSAETLHHFWSPERLRSDEARARFLLPDREPLPLPHPRRRTTAARVRRAVPLPVDAISPAADTAESSGVRPAPLPR